MTTQPRRNLASIQSAANRHDCSDKTIRRYIAQGGLTGYRFGPRRILVDLNEVDGLLKPIATVGVDTRKQAEARGSSRGLQYTYT
jgi:excisionase family DNA binding protein